MPKLSSHEIDLYSNEDYEGLSFESESLTKKQLKAYNKKRMDDYFYNKELNQYYKEYDEYWDDLETEIDEDITPH